MSVAAIAQDEPSPKFTLLMGDGDMLLSYDRSHSWAKNSSVSTPLSEARRAEPTTSHFKRPRRDRGRDLSKRKRDVGNFFP